MSFLTARGRLKTSFVLKKLKFLEKWLIWKVFGMSSAIPKKEEKVWWSWFIWFLRISYSHPSIFLHQLMSEYKTWKFLYLKDFFFDSETTFVLIRGWHLRLKSLITFYNHMSSSRAIIMVLTGRLFVKISKSAKLLCKNPQKT